MPPSYVKRSVVRQMNDHANAEAICEGVTRPATRFFEVKSIDLSTSLVSTTPSLASDHKTLGRKWAENC